MLRTLANWDDYRFFTTLAQSGSVRASADRLGVNASTVTRRLDGLEGRLGVKLFVRSHAGLELTADGPVEGLHLPVRAVATWSQLAFFVKQRV